MENQRALDVYTAVVANPKSKLLVSRAGAGEFKWW